LLIDPLTTVRGTDYNAHSLFALIQTFKNFSLISLLPKIFIMLKGFNQALRQRDCRFEQSSGFAVLLLCSKKAISF